MEVDDPEEGTIGAIDICEVAEDMTSGNEGTASEGRAEIHVEEAPEGHSAGPDDLV